MLVVRSRRQQISPLSLGFCYSTKTTKKKNTNANSELSKINTHPNGVVGDPELMWKTMDPHLLPDYQRNPQPEKPQVNPMLDFVNTFGLGDAEGSAEWRDQKLEMKIAGLFKQTIEMAQVPGAELHPKDRAIIDRAEEARRRLAHRLHDIRMKDPEQFAKIYDLIYSNIHGKLEEEKKVFTEGRIPGTLTPPWQGGGQVWKAFFEDHLNDFLGKTLDSDSYNEVIFEDGTTLADERTPPDHAFDEDPEYPFLPPTDLNEKLEQMEDPRAWQQDTKTKKKKTCIFCSPERHQFPLEPMNVNLLLRFMNPSGYIKPRSKTGLCGTMQRRVARTIKHARNLGLFQYKKGQFTINDPTFEVKQDYESRLKSAATPENEDEQVEEEGEYRNAE